MTIWHFDMKSNEYLQYDVTEIKAKKRSFPSRWWNSSHTRYEALKTKNFSSHSIFKKNWDSAVIEDV